MADILSVPYPLPARAPTPQPGTMPLPPLREDLKLLRGPATHDGMPTWTLHDPASHRFMRIGWSEFEILTRWGLGSGERIAQAVSAETTLRIVPADVIDFARFAERAGLFVPLGDGGTKRLMALRESRQMSAAAWLLKNYLFMRVRLIDPDRLLQGMLRWIGWMFTPAFALTVAFLGLLGFYLIGRQWQSFTHSFLHMFSLEGLFIVGVALSAAKVVHEFGHGLMTKRFGCRVPAMGVALLVMWPVLWTDTTDAWRLTSRRQRLLIDAAGMMAEMTLAVFAALAWLVLPDGPMRTAAFLLASSTWVLTLAINLNPLMRFDGYFLLSDLLDVPNLQERAFALARWQMRELLFGLGDPPPEHFSLARRRILLAYAYCTWIYRFSLFLGIALLVYHLAFKVLGLFLMTVEIGWFILRPIASELRVWGTRLTKRGWTRNGTFSALAAALVLAAFIVPWRAAIEAPALLRAERQTVIYTAVPGRVSQFRPTGTKVRLNEPIASLDSPDIDYRRTAAYTTVQGLRAQLAGQAFDRQGVASLEVGWQELAHAIADYQAVEAEAASLVVRAPFEGVVTDVPPSMRPGMWVPKREAIGILIDPSSQIVDAYVGEGDLPRVHPGAKAVFLPENDETPVPLTVESVGTAALAELDAPEMASLYGGGVAARKDASGKLVPEAAVYRVRLVPDQDSPAILRKQRGTVDIEGDRQSLFRRFYQRAAALVIRETGF